MGLCWFAFFFLLNSDHFFFFFLIIKIEFLLQRQGVKERWFLSGDRDCHLVDISCATAQRLCFHHFLQSLRESLEKQLSWRGDRGNYNTVYRSNYRDSLKIGWKNAGAGASLPASRTSSLWPWLSYLTTPPLPLPYLYKLGSGSFSLIQGFGYPWSASENTKCKIPE